MLCRARSFFAERDVLETDTPILSRSAVTDPQIESVAARLSTEPGRECYLHTSPEYCMKRLLCAGFPDIYEICKVFRDGEIGRQHQPEFTMVEWYRLGFELRDIMQDTVEFIGAVIDARHVTREPQFLSYREAFETFAGVDPLRSVIDALAEAAGADADLAGSLGSQRDEWLNLLIAQVIAPRFAADRLTVVHHYPASQAALARICPDDGSVADRFEVFFGELELANGYVELTDAAEQARRCQADQALRRTRSQPVRPLDDAFLEALEAGLPPCAGVAVGFDRMLMVNEEMDDIRRVQTFAAAAG